MESQLFTCSILEYGLAYHSHGRPGVLSMMKDISEICFHETTLAIETVSRFWNLCCWKLSLYFKSINTGGLWLMNYEEFNTWTCFHIPFLLSRLTTDSVFLEYLKFVKWRARHYVLLKMFFPKYVLIEQLSNLLKMTDFTNT